MDFDRGRRSTFARLAGFAFALFGLGLPAQAQSAAELATYSGADRTQRLIAGARKENALMIYSSMTVADMEAMVREQVLQRVVTPVSRELIPQATFAHGQWIATRLSVFAGAYNTNIIKRADAPRTYEDLLHPRFKGKLAVEAEDANWFMSVVLSMGEQKGLKLFRDIVAANGMSVRKGHTLLANLVPTGEVPLALTAYSYRVEQLKHERAPVEIIYLPLPVAFPTGIGMFRHAPHPHAALLFQDFILSDGQKILAEREAVPTNPKVKAAPDGLIFVDLPRFMDEGAKWTRLFRETFTVR